jgi:hypothetical protein
MHSRHFSAAALVLACLVGQAHGQAACPPPASSIAAGNTAALALFQQRVVKPAQVGAAAQSRAQGMETPEAYGAKGDGVADDTRALQQALSKRAPVWLAPGRTFRFSRRLELGPGSGLVSDGTATLLMSAAAGAFDNREAQRNDRGAYSERGAGMRVTGDNVTISDLFLVKEYVDGQYVIGIDVVGASNVLIRRVRLRGFSTAPGIITIRSSNSVEVVSSLINNSCTKFNEVPPDVASYQITGISVDDSRVGGRGSTGVMIRNNVIADIHMVPVTPRGNQSDGINFAGSGTGSGSVIADNDIQGMDEGIDLFGAGIEVRGNRIAATGLGVKLIHGARDIVVSDNVLTPGPKGRGIGLYRAHDPARQVKDVRIERNRIDMSASDREAILVDDVGELPPMGIAVRQNKFVMAQCQQEAVRCSPRQCKGENNDKVQARGGAACRP